MNKGPGYLYPLGMIKPKSTYKNYNFYISGTNKKGHNDLDKFRFGSKYFKLGFLANWEQDKRSEI